MEIMKIFTFLLSVVICALLNADVIITPADWLNFNHISGVKVEDNCLSGRFAGIDPFMISKKLKGVKAGNIEYITFDLKLPVDCTSTAQIFWKTAEDDNFSHSRHLNVKLQNDDQWHTYRINIKAYRNWSGEITGIRFDPAVAPEKLESFKLRNFKLLDKNSTAENKSPTVVIKLDTTAGKPETGSYPETMFSPTGALLIDGKPVFVLGTGDIPVVDSPFSQLAQAGFNIVTFSGVSKGLIRELEKNKLYTMLAIHYDRNETVESFGKKVSGMYAKYPELKNVVAAYYAVDEPVWLGFPLNPMKEAYSVYKKLNPRRPVWVNHAPRNSVDLLKKFNVAADITGCDIYPVPDGGHSNLSDKTLSSVGAYTDKMFQTALSGQPVWMYLQAYARAKTIPTYQQTRFMAYNAIMHGAMGIYYYGLRHLAWPNKMWPQLQTIGRELRSLNEILVAPWSSELIKKDGIEIRFKKLNGKLFIFAANTVNAEKELMFSVGVDCPEMSVLFENRKIKSANKIFRDNFKPYSVHIYGEDDIRKINILPVNKSNLTWISQSDGYWIWDAKSQKKKNATVYFRRIIAIDEMPANATITITGDNDYRLYCNGQLVGSDIQSSQGGWQIAERYDLKPFLRSHYQNVIAVEGINETGMAALWAEIKLGEEKIVTDEQWRVSSVKNDKWKGDFSDENWDCAQTYGQPPVEPWNSFMVPAK